MNTDIFRQFFKEYFYPGNKRSGTPAGYSCIFCKTVLVQSSSRGQKHLQKHHPKEYAAVVEPYAKRREETLIHIDEAYNDGQRQILNGTWYVSGLHGSQQIDPSAQLGGTTPVSRDSSNSCGELTNLDRTILLRALANEFMPAPTPNGWMIRLADGRIARYHGAESHWDIPALEPMTNNNRVEGGDE